MKSTARGRWVIPLIVALLLVIPLAESEFVKWKTRSIGRGVKCSGVERWGWKKYTQQVSRRESDTYACYHADVSDTSIVCGSNERVRHMTIYFFDFDVAS